MNFIINIVVTMRTFVHDEWNDEVIEICIDSNYLLNVYIYIYEASFLQTESQLSILYEIERVAYLFVKMENPFPF